LFERPVVHDRQRVAFPPVLRAVDAPRERVAKLRPPGDLRDLRLAREIDGEAVLLVDIYLPFFLGGGNTRH
jgi:hypothetical protein